MGARALLVRAWRAYDDRHFCYRILPAESVDCAVFGERDLLDSFKTEGRGIQKTAYESRLPCGLRDAVRHLLFAFRKLVLT